MANPWLERRVLNYAHQGGAKEEPSSTLRALRTAVAAGATAIELDVHATRDGALVVCHDTTVDRTTGASGRIADLTLAEVLALDNAYWFAPGTGTQTAPGLDDEAYVYRGLAPGDHDFGVATVDEVLAEFTGVFLNFDIKQTAPDVESYEAALADAIRRHGREDDVIVASFHDVATERFRAAAPEIATSCGTSATAHYYYAVRNGEPRPDDVAPHVALQVPRTYGDVTLVDESFVSRAHDDGLAVHVWTIDDPVEMAELLDLGVDGIITDRPSLLTPLLAERGLDFRAG